MELTEYIKFRWKYLAAILLVGVIVIVSLGVGLRKNDYVASTQLLIRPAGDLSTTYASDLDRYINTEMTFLYTPSTLREVASGTDVTAAQVGQSLTFTHNTGSDIVTFEVSRSKASEAVLLANKVADTYLETSLARDGAPLRGARRQLAAQTARLRDKLDETNATIQQAAAAYARQNPDRGIPSASVIAPAASSELDLLTAQLQHLSQEQLDLEPSAEPTSSSEVLRRAVRATAPPGWGVTVYVAALVGLLLVLLALACLGLVLSTRVFGESRWSRVTAGIPMARPVRLQSRNEAQRRRTVRAVVASLRSMGEPELPTLAACLPETTSAMEGKTSFLLEALEAEGFRVKRVDSPADALAPRSSESDGIAGTTLVTTRVVLLVDLATCRTADAVPLGDFPASALNHVVPVLV